LLLGAQRVGDIDRPIIRPSHTAAAGLLLRARQHEIPIDSGGRRAPQQYDAQQHGVQQQMRAVSRCQLT